MEAELDPTRGPSPASEKKKKKTRKRKTRATEGPTHQFKSKPWTQVIGVPKGMAYALDLDPELSVHDLVHSLRTETGRRPKSRFVALKNLLRDRDQQAVEKYGAKYTEAREAWQKQNAGERERSKSFAGHVATMVYGRGGRKLHKDYDYPPDDDWEHHNKQGSTTIIAPPRKKARTAEVEGEPPDVAAPPEEGPVEGSGDVQALSGFGQHKSAGTRYSANAIEDAMPSHEQEIRAREQAREAAAEEAGPTIVQPLQGTGAQDEPMPAAEEEDTGGPMGQNILVNVGKSLVTGKWDKESIRNRKVLLNQTSKLATNYNILDGMMSAAGLNLGDGVTFTNLTGVDAAEALRSEEALMQFANKLADRNPDAIEHIQQQMLDYGGNDTLDKFENYRRGGRTEELRTRYGATLEEINEAEPRMQFEFRKDMDRIEQQLFNASDERRAQLLEEKSARETRFYDEQAALDERLPQLRTEAGEQQKAIQASERVAERDAPYLDKVHQAAAEELENIDLRMLEYSSKEVNGKLSAAEKADFERLKDIYSQKVKAERDALEARRQELRGGGRSQQEQEIQRDLQNARGNAEKGKVPDAAGEEMKDAPREQGNVDDWEDFLNEPDDPINEPMGDQPMPDAAGGGEGIDAAVEDVQRRAPAVDVEPADVPEMGLPEAGAEAGAGGAEAVGGAAGEGAAVGDAAAAGVPGEGIAADLLGEGQNVAEGALAQQIGRASFGQEFMTTEGRMMARAQSMPLKYRQWVGDLSRFNGINSGRGYQGLFGGWGDEMAWRAGQRFQKTTIGNGVSRAAGGIARGYRAASSSLRQSALEALEATARRTEKLALKESANVAERLAARSLGTAAMEGLAERGLAAMTSEGAGVLASEGLLRGGLALAFGPVAEAAFLGYMTYEGVKFLIEDGDKVVDFFEHFGDNMEGLGTAFEESMVGWTPEHRERARKEMEAKKKALDDAVAFDLSSMELSRQRQYIEMQTPEWNRMDNLNAEGEFMATLTPEDRLGFAQESDRYLTGNIPWLEPEREGIGSSMETGRAKEANIVSDQMAGRDPDVTFQEPLAQPETATVTTQPSTATSVPPPRRQRLAETY